jgi:hypothetical protein
MANWNRAYLLPLCNKAALKLLLDESIKSLHSFTSYSILNFSINPKTSLQCTKTSSWDKYGINYFSRFLYHEKEVPGDSIFFDLSLEPNTSAESLRSPKSLTKSFNSLWEKRWGSVLHGSHLKSWFLSMSSLSESTGVSYKISGGTGTGIPGPWGTGRIADGRFG